MYEYCSVQSTVNPSNKFSFTYVAAASDTDDQIDVRLLRAPLVFLSHRIDPAGRGSALRVLRRRLRRDRSVRGRNVHQVHLRR